jgi:hypothetical protein
MSINRNALKKYAPKARRDFIAAVTARAGKFGINDGEPVPMQEQGDVVIIGGEAFPKEIGAQRKALLGRIRLHGFGHTMEEVAYTWFNRFLAIRFMELHGYLDHGFRVLSHPNGGDHPEIIEHAEHLELAGLNKARVVDLKLDGTKDAELYRLLLIAQCNALHDAMPFMFEKIDDETELLLPDNLLHSDSLIRRLVNEIDESDWQEIEIIGWLYQFYISEKKNQVIGKVVKSEDIPAATQLFTPNWIVKYMVQNSLGHQWMATYPESSLKDGMDYYIEPAEQTPEVQAQLAEITPKELNPEELTLLDPAAGSGHILVEAYDLFKQIYLERGYRLRDIPRLILTKNLYGLDIDDRAAQMAGFALLMKARADDKRILSNPVHLNVMAIQSSEGMDAADVAKHLLSTDTTGEVKAGTIESLINLFEDAKTFGSLITVPDNIKKALPALGQLFEQPSNGDLLQRQMREHAKEAVSSLVAQANMLGRQYDCVVANPPYMSRRGMNNALKKYILEYYEDSVWDIYSAFIIKNLDLTKRNGNSSYMTPQTWMSLGSHAELRNIILSNTINSLVQLSYSGFDGAAVAVCSFSVKKLSTTNFLGTYVRLSDFADPKMQATKTREAITETNSSWRYDFDQNNFKKIPGSTIAYWSEDFIINCFSSLDKIGDFNQGQSLTLTGNNDKYIRFWWELPSRKIGIGRGWLFYVKGGKFRKWYGNYDYVINWSDEAIQHYRNDKTARIIPEKNWYKTGVSWTFVTSAISSFRHLRKDAIYDVGGASILLDEDYLCDAIGFLNTLLAEKLIDVVNSSVNLQVGDVEVLPLPRLDSDTRDAVNQLIEISKVDWDSKEISFEFEKHNFFNFNSLNKNFIEYLLSSETIIDQSIELEKKLNQDCLNKFDIKDDKLSIIQKNRITLHCNSEYLYNEGSREENLIRFRTDYVTDILSYSIGCMMGRYSLAEEGLIYANSGNEGFDRSRYGDFPADGDGIIPVTDVEWFDDDATVRFEDFLKVAWSPETLSENLKFIGDSLANNGGNDPQKTIRNYLSKGFFKDHLKTYKKRPIYWLFSSGKLRAFECLVYLHRFNEGTLARMRMEYVTPLQSRMSARIDQLGGDVNSASSSAERNHKQKEKDKLVKQLEELRNFDEELRHYADRRITFDLDDGVKVNYGKFGNLLADVKAITGKK